MDHRCPGTGGIITASTSAAFNEFSLPDGKGTWIPTDSDLRLPETPEVGACRLNALAFIPQDDRLPVPLDPDGRGVLQSVPPDLDGRTTDVPTATCLPFARELIAAEAEPVNERVPHLVFLLFDCGWSPISEEDTAGSIWGEGWAPPPTATAPKARHTELGRDPAQRLLREFPSEPPLTAGQEEMMFRAILVHDKSDQFASPRDLPASVRAVSDVDSVWSCADDGSWQHTVRKGVNPPAYLANLDAEPDSCFVDEAGAKSGRGSMSAQPRSSPGSIGWRANTSRTALAVQLSPCAGHEKPGAASVLGSPPWASEGSHPL